MPTLVTLASNYDIHLTTSFTYGILKEVKQTNQPTKQMTLANAQTYYTLQTTTHHSKGKTVTRKCVGTMTPQQLNAYVLLPTEKLIARNY